MVKFKKINLQDKINKCSVCKKYNIDDNQCSCCKKKYCNNCFKKFDNIICFFENYFCFECNDKLNY